MRPEDGIFGEIDDETGDNLGVDSGEFGEGLETQPADEETAVVEEEADPTADLREQVTQLTRRLSEAESIVQRAYPALQQQQLTQQAEKAKPPVEWDKIQTTDQLKAYMDWQMGQREQELVARMTQTANQASSEATVRGVFTRDVVGAGWSYDDVVSKYVDPAIRQDNKLGEFFASQSDPAMNKFMFGLFHGVMDAFKGDPVKMVKAIVGSVTKPGQAAKDVVNRLDAATKRGAMKVLTGSKGKQSGGGKIGNYNALSEKEFNEILAANS